MALTKRKDGRWCKSKTINDTRIFFYSSESTERRAMKDIETQMIEYSGKIEKGKLFKDVADEWEREHYKQVQYQTALRYKSLTARIVKHFGKRYIRNITTDNIMLFMDMLVNEQFSTKSIKDEMSVIKMIFKYAKIKEYVSENVALYLVPPKGKAKEERSALSDDEIQVVENSIDSDFGLLAFFILYSGLRKGEALALEWEDIDFEQNIIKVNKSVEFVGCSPRLKAPKTKAGERIVPLIDKLKDVLATHRATGIVFNQDGHHMNSSYFQRHWKGYTEETGLIVSPHQLRHTFTTLLYEWDISDKDTQEILGHADISTTRNIYTHIRQSRMTETLMKINQKLSKGCQDVVEVNKLA